MGGGYRTICGAVVVVLSLMVGSTMVRQQGPLPPPHPAVPSAPPLETTDRFYACIKQKQAKAELNCGSRCDVVFVGDSITEGLTSEYCYWNMTGISMCGLAFCPLYDDEGGRAFRQGFKPFKKSLIIAGAGDETQHTLAVLDAVLPVLKAPKVYSVLIGTNNIPAFSAPGNVSLVLQGITAVVARLRDAHPGSKVLLHALTPRADDSPEGFSRGYPDFNKPWQERISEVNKALESWASMWKPDVEFVKCSGVFPLKSLTDYMPDMLHPNGAGYLRWFKCWEEVVEQALAENI